MATSIVTSVREHLHKIRAKLYEAHFKDVVGKFFARTVHEASLTVEMVCSALFNRGGFLGSYNDLVDHVNQFLIEAVYQLLDGYSINMGGYFTIYPHITGLFNSADEPYDKQKNPLKFRFKSRPKLRRLIDEIEVFIDGLADTVGSIFRFYNVDEDADNIFAAGDQIIVDGAKIKIEGDVSQVGMFIVPVDDPAAAVKVARVALNTPTKIVAVAPATGHQYNRVEIRTQYTGATNALLKEPRVISGSMIVEEV
jgi:hypothetical protein